MTLRQGDVVAKKFEIDREVGAGPMGATYAARSLTNGKRVALKMMDGPSVGLVVAAGVVQRVQAARSEALIPIVDFGEDRGALFVASEFFEAESLRRLMDTYAGERKSFSLQEACQIVVRVLEAVDAAHQAGLVHRHVKPGTVLVNSKSVGPGQGKIVRTVRLGGLGFSELLNNGTLAENINERPDSRYMAPELASPSSGGTVQSDLYSVGVIFYELLTGQTPMGTYLSPTSIRDDLPKHVDDVVDIAIAANAEDRYPSARAMINDIQRAFTDDDKPAAGVSRRTLGTVVGGSAMVLGLIVAFFALNDPAARAGKDDEALRARVIKENVIDQGVMKEKSVGHPNMAYIPDGTFIAGRMQAETNAGQMEPQWSVQKAPAYYVDLFEYPNELGGHAVVGATRGEAEAACAQRGKRLCSATEWERACKGPEMQIYGYGNTYNAETCGDPGGDQDKDGRLDRASGSQEKCKSGWGVYDLSGGAIEWTNGSSDKEKGMLKGGKLQQPIPSTRCAYGAEQRSNLTNHSIGFRCCMDDNGQLPTVPAPPADPTPPAP